MKNLSQIERQLSKHKKRLEERFSVKSIAIFGSYARGDANEASDVDILIDFEKPIGLEFVDLADYLEELLHIKVDLVSRGAVKDRWLNHIQKDVIYV